MSSQKPNKKKVVVTSGSTNNKKSVAASPRKSTKTKSTANSQSVEMVFGRENFIWMGAGILLIVIGLALMTGGAMPSPDVWDDSIIYSFRRSVLAPFCMVAGLGLEIYGIFKKKGASDS